MEMGGKYWAFVIPNFFFFFVFYSSACILALKLIDQYSSCLLFCSVSPGVIFAEREAFSLSATFKRESLFASWLFRRLAYSCSELLDWWRFKSSSNSSRLIIFLSFSYWGGFAVAMMGTKSSNLSRLRFGLSLAVAQSQVPVSPLA